MHRSHATRLGVVLVLAVIGFVLVVPPSANAQTTVVIRRVTVGGATAGECGDKTDWSNPCSLQHALRDFTPSANNTLEIWVAAGTYKPTGDQTAAFELGDRIEVYGGFAGTETARDQRNWATNITILSGDIGTPGDSSDNSYHVVKANNVANTAVLDGFTITGGNGSSSDGAGGGMFNSGSSATLRNLTFSGNSAPGGGGAMYNQNSNLSLTNVTFTGNSGPMGGAMYNSGGKSSTYPVLTNVTVAGNSGSSASAVYDDNSSPTIRNSIIWGNTGGPQVSNNGTSSPNISYSVMGGGCPLGSACTPGTIIIHNPRLGALGGYSAASQVIPLLPGSSAIDAGSEAICPSTDQRGVTRVPSSCDIGAFESRGFTLTKTSGDGQSTPRITAFADPLAVAVSSDYGEPVDGGWVTFTAGVAGSGATATLTTPDVGPAATITATIASGSASVNAVANDILGTYNVTASAAGAVPVDFSLTNSKIDTLTTITSHTTPGSALNHSVVGESVPVTFTVVAMSGGGTPTGSVTVSDGEDSPCTIDITVDTWCSILLTTAGPKTLTATYSGDGDYGPSSNPVAHTVDMADTTASITFDVPDPSVVGQTVAISYTVDVTPPGSGTPTGDVLVGDGTNTCTDSVATGACNITFMTAGSHTLTASFQGDANYKPSLASPGQSHTVNKANTITTLSSSTPSSSIEGSPFTVHFTVAVNTPGAGTPTGTVTVADGDATCQAALPATSCSLTLFNPGARNLTATFSGDADYIGSAASAGHSIANLVPTLTALSRTTSSQGSPGFTLTVTGTNFISGSVVQWKGNGLTTSFVSATQLSATVPNTLLSSPGAAAITVRHPGTNGDVSNALTYTVSPVQPSTSPSLYLPLLRR